MAGTNVVFIYQELHGRTNMAEPKPIPLCHDCDHLCEQVEDGECQGRANKTERQAILDNLAWMYLNNAHRVVANPSEIPVVTLENG